MYSQTKQCDRVNDDLRYQTKRRSKLESIFCCFGIQIQKILGYRNWLKLEKYNASRKWTSEFGPRGWLVPSFKIRPISSRFRWEVVPQSKIPHVTYSARRKILMMMMTCLAYGWRAWNLSWPIRIQQVGKKTLLSWIQRKLQHWRHATFLAGNGIRYSGKGVYNSKNHIRL